MTRKEERRQGTYLNINTKRNWKIGEGSNKHNTSHHDPFVGHKDKNQTSQAQTKINHNQKIIENEENQQHTINQCHYTFQHTNILRTSQTGEWYKGINISYPKPTIRHTIKVKVRHFENKKNLNHKNSDKRDIQAQALNQNQGTNLVDRRSKNHQRVVNNKNQNRDHKEENSSRQSNKNVHQIINKADVENMQPNQKQSHQSNKQNCEGSNMNHNKLT